MVFIYNKEIVHIKLYLCLKGIYKQFLTYNAAILKLLLHTHILSWLLSNLP